MVTRVILILGDQLSLNLSALKGATPDDLIVMAEVMGEATYVAHHPKKIALVFSAMRRFADKLISQGLQVRYTKLDDPENTNSICGELERAMRETGARVLRITEAGEWRLRQELEQMPGAEILADDRFVTSQDEFADWAEGRKQLRMEFFYRLVRRKTGLLMEGDDPAGGKWNYDAENRKPAADDLFMPSPMRHAPDAGTQEVLALVGERFSDNFGSLDDFWFATTREDALASARHFMGDALPGFGDYQDAMLDGQSFLYHSVLSMYLNLGLLEATELCQMAEEEYRAGRAALNAVEGFIRQIIGWREYVRGLYFWAGPDYTASNFLQADRALPAFYWSGDTDMACMAATIEQTEAEAYAHHIQRLMVTGNFALLAGVAPHEVHEWYLALYADAFEWVEAPNTIGMSQFADGGLLASKPYAASGAYINRMSNYCEGCRYNVAHRTEADACPFNALYWDFLHRNRGKIGKNQRLSMPYRNWDRMAEDKREALLAKAADVLSRLDAGERL